MGRYRIKSIRHEVLVTIMGVVLMSLISTGLFQYFSEVSTKKDHIIEKSMISLLPIISLANRNINGGNLMNLRNASAQDLYKTFPDLFFLKLSGMSAGSDKTDFSEAIPPRRIEYTYVKQGITDAAISKMLKKADNVEAGDSLVDGDGGILITRVFLQTKNGGEALAVFSAHALKGVAFSIFKKQILVFIIVLVLSTLVAVRQGKQIAGPVVKVAEKITYITQSLDLSTTVNVDSKNEIGDLAHWFNKHIDNLKHVIGEFTKLTLETGTSATQISAVVQEQASIATEQAATISEITATVEELSASSSQIADNSSEVVNHANNAFKLSENGVVSLDHLKTKMDEINHDNKENIKEIIDLGKKSKEIGKVMEIINNIADQTKLIAFNAAIEASSAGEAGKRFSVVAVEIRRLADNVMESTEEIAHKVEEIQSAITRLVVSSELGSKKIADGTAAVSGTMDELLNIVEGAKSTSETASQISLATQQQKTATEQALNALREIDEGLRQSSISIKQTTSITRNLTELSGNLKKIVETFKLNGSDPPRKETL